MADDDRYEQARSEIEALLASRPADEVTLGDALDRIAIRASDDLGPLAGEEFDPERAWDVLAAVQAWASLASYAFQHVYADEPPAVGTPFLRFPGSKKDVMKALHSVCSRFQPALDGAMPSTRGRFLLHLRRVPLGCLRRRFVGAIRRGSARTPGWPTARGLDDDRHL